MLAKCEDVVVPGSEGRAADPWHVCVLGPRSLPNCIAWSPHTQAAGVPCLLPVAQLGIWTATLPPACRLAAAGCGSTDIQLHMHTSWQDNLATTVTKTWLLCKDMARGSSG